MNTLILLKKVLRRLRHFLRLRTAVDAFGRRVVGGAIDLGCTTSDDDADDGMSGDVENKYRGEKDVATESGGEKDEDNGRVEVDAVVEILKSGDVVMDEERGDGNKRDGNATEGDGVGNEDNDDDGCDGG